MIRCFVSPVEDSVLCRLVDVIYYRFWRHWRAVRGQADLVLRFFECPVRQRLIKV
jgi:hypothetical protein